MKLLFVSYLACAAAVVAQPANTERVSVPLTDPNRPATIRVDTMRGEIVVRGHDAKEVVIESAADRGRRSPRRGPAEVDGLKRIDIGGSDVNVEERENLVTVNSMGHGGRIEVLVPRTSNLRLKTMTGEITVDGVRGEIEATSMNGEVTISNVEGSVVAHSLNGAVKVSLSRAEAKPMSFSTMNGDIDVRLPADIKARFKIKADHGDLYSDFDLKLEPGNAPQTTREGGQYKVRFDRTAFATVNGGGPEISFRTVNGQIRIRQNK
jgi:hypothetical protein